MKDLTHDSIKYSILVGSLIVVILYKQEMISLLTAGLYFLSIILNQIAFISLLRKFDYVEEEKPKDKE